MLLRSYLTNKIHGIRLTDKNVAYVGSLTLSPEILAASGMSENEVVHVVNVTTGARLTTYIILGKEPGQCVLNGGAARHAEVGDELIVMAFGVSDKPVQPRIAFMTPNNKVERIVGPQ